MTMSDDVSFKSIPNIIVYVILDHREFDRLFKSLFKLTHKNFWQFLRGISGDQPVDSPDKGQNNAEGVSMSW